MQVTLSSTKLSKPTVEEVESVGAFFSDIFLDGVEALHIVDDEGNVIRIRSDAPPYKLSVSLRSILESDYFKSRLPRPGETVTITF